MSQLNPTTQYLTTEHMENHTAAAEIVGSIGTNKSQNDTRTKSKQLSTIELTSALGIQPNQRTRRTWSATEDSKLRTLVAEWGDQRGKNSHWDRISESMEGRTSKDCRKRWFHSLDPTLKRGRWTSEEDRVLVEAYDNYGPAWNRIAQLIIGRTDDQCSKRYNDVLDPNVQNRLRQWTEQEDAQLMKMFKEYGTQWKTIASKMNGRTGLTCRNRWRKLASSSIKKGKKLSINSRTNSIKRKCRKSVNREMPDVNRLTPETMSGQSSDELTPQKSTINADVLLSPTCTKNASNNLVSTNLNNSALLAPSLGSSSKNRLPKNRRSSINIGSLTEANFNPALRHEQNNQFKTKLQQQQQQHLNSSSCIFGGLSREAEKFNIIPTPFQESSSSSYKQFGSPSALETRRSNSQPTQNRDFVFNNFLPLSSHDVFEMDPPSIDFSQNFQNKSGGVWNHQNNFSNPQKKAIKPEAQYNSDSLNQEDFVAIVQAAKVNGVAVVIHQHNYHNHYHNYHLPRRNETQTDMYSDDSSTDRDPGSAASDSMDIEMESSTFDNFKYVIDYEALIGEESVNLETEAKLVESFSLCNTRENKPYKPTNFNNENSGGDEDALPGEMLLQPHPHFIELEQIDMDTDPFSWIPAFPTMNTPGLLSCDPIPCNPS